MLNRSEHENPSCCQEGIATVVSCPPLKHCHGETGKSQAAEIVKERDGLSNPTASRNRWRRTRFLTESSKSSLIILGAGRAKSMYSFVKNSKRMWVLTSSRDRKKEWAHGGLEGGGDGGQKRGSGERSERAACYAPKRKSGDWAVAVLLFGINMRASLPFIHGLSFALEPWQMHAIFSEKREV